MLPIRKAAAAAGLELVEIWVESPNEYATAFAVMHRAGAEALVIVPTPELYRDTEQLGALAAKARLPTIGGFRESAQGGLLIGYGPSLRELGRQAAGYVERILNGAQAGELPFQGPTRFDFAINMRTAKALGLAVSPRERRRDDRIASLLRCMSLFLALNVTCGNATIPSLSGDKRTHRDHRQSVARGRVGM